jgi:DNA-binding CsgD family transcriptional regulator
MDSGLKAFSRHSHEHFLPATRFRRIIFDTRLGRTALKIRDMTGEEIAVFADVIRELARPVFDVDLRKTTSDRILRLLRGDTLASYVWEPRKARFDGPVTVNHDAGKVAQYVASLQFSDPLTRRMRLLRGAQIVENCFPMAELGRTEFYNDFLQPEGMHHGMNVFLPASLGKVYDLRIWRNRHRDPFGQREIDLLDTLALHVAEALKSGDEGLAALSPREHEIGRLIARGCTDKEMSDLLGIRFSTVRTHVNRCFEKLQCSNRAELSARFSATLLG